MVRKYRRRNAYGNSNPAPDYCCCLSGGHAGCGRRCQQGPDQECQGLHGGRPPHGPVHGSILPVRQQYRRRLHHGPGPEGLRRLGHERHLPDLLADRRFRRRHQRPDSVHSPERVPDLRGCGHHSLYHHGRHDRRPDLRPAAIRHHPGGPGHRHPHCAEPRRRLERHFRRTAR